MNFSMMCVDSFLGLVVLGAAGFGAGFGYFLRTALRNASAGEAFLEEVVFWEGVLEFAFGALPLLLFCGGDIASC